MHHSPQHVQCLIVCGADGADDGVHYLDLIGLDNIKQFNQHHFI